MNAATQAALAAGQSINSIDLGSGTASYQGDGSVVRLPVTQADRDAFALFNSTRTPGNQRAVVGGINFLRTTFFNKSSEFVNGFDFDLTYRFPAMSVGNFIFDTNWTYLNSFFAYNAATAPRTDLRGTNSFAVGGASPKWRGSMALTWRRQQWGAGVSAYYIGNYTDSGATTTQATYESLGSPTYIQAVFTNGSNVFRYVVHDTVTYNAYVSYRFRTANKWTNGTQVRLGVINLTDKKPPLSSDSRGYDPALYNQMARGLSWSVQITKKL